jgi:hypothetical protein
MDFGTFIGCLSFMVGIGVAMMQFSPPMRLVARGCFSLAAIFLAASYLGWELATPAHWIIRALAALLMALALGVLFPISWQWTRENP